MPKMNWAIVHTGTAKGGLIGWRRRLSTAQEEARMFARTLGKPVAVWDDGASEFVMTVYPDGVEIEGYNDSLTKPEER